MISFVFGLIMLFFAYGKASIVALVFCTTAAVFGIYEPRLYSCSMKSKTFRGFDLTTIIAIANALIAFVALIRWAIIAFS